jgi:hypothetical protein
VGNDSTGSASGNTTLAAGDHGDANDGAQEAGGSTDSHLDDLTDNQAEVVALVSNISYAMLAGGRPLMHVLCIPYGEFFYSFHLHTQLLSINPLISCTDWMGQQEELDMYAAMAYSLLDILTQWNSWRLSDAMCERELCRAMRGGPPRFHTYCRALPLERLGAGHVDVEAATARTYVQRYWWQMQLAAMYEVGNAINSAQCSAMSSHYDKRLRKLRRAKERDKASIDKMLREKAQALATVPEPLD